MRRSECGVTLSGGDARDSGDRQAAQFQEYERGRWAADVTSVSPSEIPESAKQWNATREDDGTLSLGAP